MKLPAVVVSYSGDHGIFPSDTELITSSLAAPDVARVDIDADHYGFAASGSPSGRDAAVRAISDWIRATG
jgi:hypothetical protein